MTKYNKLVERAIEMIRTNDDLMIELVDELDACNGYADGFRAYDMCELDDFYSGVSAAKLLEDLTADFNKYDEWFYFSIYGLESTDDKADLYRANTDAGEIFDNVLENLNHLNIYNYDFREIMEEISNYNEDAQEDETAESAISAAAATLNGMMEGFEKTFQRSAETVLIRSESR